MVDIETRVSDVLAARAERPVEVERLRVRAVRKATAIRRRRRLLGTAAMILIVVGVIAGVRLPAGGAPQTTLPLETAAPPGGVGSDPGLLHFDLDWRVVDAASRSGVHGTREAATTEWIAGYGYERLVVRDVADQMWIDVLLTPSQEDLAKHNLGQSENPARRITLGGLPATVREVTFNSQTAWELHWQPAEGVYGAVIVDGQDEALTSMVARAVRLDRVQRCVMPLRVADLPAGAKWSECQVEVRRRQPAGQSVFVHSGLTVMRPDGNWVYVWATERRDDDPEVRAAFHPDRTVSGYPAQWLDTDQTGLWLAAFGPLDLFVTGINSKQATWLTPDDARWLAERTTYSPDLSAPATWPR